MTKRKMKPQRQAMIAKVEAQRAAAWREKNPCTNCGMPGPHFVPPSLGDSGFYICDQLDR